MQKIRLLNTILVFSFTISLIACSSNSESESIEQTPQLMENENSGLSEQEEEEFNFIMPSALQITSIFTRSGNDFNEVLMNNVNNSKSYVSKNTQLLNLGVYTSDLCYAVLNNQSQLSMEYFKAVKSLSEQVGMASIFSSGPLFERFEKNIGNRDSVIFIMADLQEQTDLYVKRSDQEHLAMVIFAGAWAEGMYIGLNNANELTKGDDIVPRIVEQMTLLSNLIKGLEVQPQQTDEIVELTNVFKDLKNYFENLEGVDLENFEYDVEKITSENLAELKNKVNNLRNNIISINS